MLGVQQLEQRDCPANIYTVTIAGDAGAQIGVQDKNNVNSGDLRWCIVEANTIGGASTITIDNAKVGGNIAIKSQLGVSNAGGDQITTSDGNACVIDAGGKSRIFDITTGGSLTLVNLTLQNGLVATGNGGGILVEGNASLNMINSTITGCAATNVGVANGGAIDAEGSGNTINVDLSIIKSCTAAKNGGGIYEENGTITLENVTFTADIANGKQVSQGGGGVATTNADATINSSVFQSCVSASYGGGIYSQFTLNQAHTVTLDNDSITSNTAVYGGGVALSTIVGFAQVATVNIQDSTLIDSNFATQGGGGLYLSAANASTNILTNSVISNNTAGMGGGIYFNTGTLTFDGTQSIGNNTATQADGGGILMGSGIYRVKNATVENGNPNFFGGNTEYLA